MGKQGKGRRLTDKERLEIIALSRQNPRVKHVELAAKYNVNESTIRKWRTQNNASKIEERYAQGVAASRDGRQRGQAVRNTQFDAELYEWVVGMMKQEKDLAPARVREKARSMAAQYDGMEGFKASSGWFYRFCRRYGLPCGPAGRDTSSKAHEEMPVDTMIPLEMNAHVTDGAVLEQPVHAAEPPASFPPNQAVVVPSNNNAAAIAMSLQPPRSQAPEPSVEAEPSGVGTETSELEEKVSETPLPAANAAVVLHLGDMAPPAPRAAQPPTTLTDNTVSPSTTTSATSTVAAPQVFSMAQAASTHMVQHFKDMLDPQTRLRLVRHFTRVAGEAEMYLVMDDETRLEYIKEFAATSSTPAPAPLNTTNR